MAVTKITTGVPPHPKQPIYGERALDMVFGMDQFTPNKKEFSLAEFFGEEPVMRMTTLASPKMVVGRLKKLFGEDPQFTEEMANKMLAKMLEDLHANRKEEYMSEVGIAILFDRSGGKLTSKMSDVIATVKALMILRVPVEMNTMKKYHTHRTTPNHTTHTTHTPLANSTPGVSLEINQQEG